MGPRLIARRAVRDLPLSVEFVADRYLGAVTERCAVSKSTSSHRRARISRRRMPVLAVSQTTP